MKYYEHKLSRNTLELAIRDAKLIEREKAGSKSQIKMSDDRDLIGAMAQYGVFELVRSWGIELESTTPFYIPGASFDNYDFMHRGQKVDVKGSKNSEYNSFLIKKDSAGLVNPERYMDMFCFVHVEIPDSKIYVAGVISRKDVLNPDIHQEPPVKYPAYSVHQKYMTDFKDYIYGTKPV